jgi:hypothetical protein
MVIKNSYGAPQTLVNWMKRDAYSRGGARKSITQLIGPPRIDILRERHGREMTVDVVDRLWALLGTAIHHIVEQGGDADHVTEERLFLEVEGWVISGAIDVQRLMDNSIRILDYKLCSVWSVIKAKPDWERQLNCYAYLVEAVKGIRVDRLEICAFIRDWSRSEAQKAPNYPQAPLQVVPVKLWPMAEREEYVRNRVRFHQDALRKAEWGESIPECSEEERWSRGATWAVVKEGAKRALRVFDTPEEAEAFAAEKPEERRVEHRPGEPVRCTGNYCGVAQWCDQFRRCSSEHSSSPLGRPHTGPDIFSIEEAA